MNKVINIEIAGQVFWIDEDAYKVLNTYLDKIRQQLADDESADDIFQDIELRIAELLYALRSDEQKAISVVQLDQVIEQVGFIDSEIDDEVGEAEIPRRSYRDPQNKILGGVCAGLATRFRVPAFFVRLIFISLTALFGLGIALYLIFWIFLDTNSSRNNALAAQGKARTARQIASYDGLVGSDGFDADFSHRHNRIPQNKILAGVCAELAMRMRVPAFIMRLSFIAMAFAFGLGIFLYLIFWLSLDTQSSRDKRSGSAGNDALARQPSPAPKENPFYVLQRILFLPLSIIGMLITFISQHFSNRKTIYFFLIKNAFAASLIFASFAFCVLLYEFNRSWFFPQLIIWILSGAAVYLVALILAIYISEYYLTKPYFRVEKELKLAALIPIAMITAAFLMGYDARSIVESELVQRSFSLNSEELNIEFDTTRPAENYADHARITARTKASADQELTISITYSGRGSSREKALESIHATEYNFSFVGNTLSLNEFWALQEGALNRSQEITVLIEIPQNIRVNSQWPLNIDQNSAPASYRLRHLPGDLIETGYLTRGEYIHENDENIRSRVSDNERVILIKKFCEEFFISESWRCHEHSRTRVATNRAFDRAFADQVETIEQLRLYLLPNRSLFVSNLTEMNVLISELGVEISAMSELRDYIEQLIYFKSSDL